WYLRRLLETRRHESSLHSSPVTPLRRWLSSAVRCSHSRWLFAGRAGSFLCRPYVDDGRREYRAAR
ncbi:MAG: hypothetical protein KAR22_15075, partial [Gammaproteobacteria bacterium]|nr:hypothetical protein [Gammaproteobacteria bacterium]